MTVHKLVIKLVRGGGNEKWKGCEVNRRYIYVHLATYKLKLKIGH